jgi:hypothetical protein
MHEKQVFSAVMSGGGHFDSVKLGNFASTKNSLDQVLNDNPIPSTGGLAVKYNQKC